MVKGGLFRHLSDPQLASVCSIKSRRGPLLCCLVTIRTCMFSLNFTHPFVHREESSYMGGGREGGRMYRIYLDILPWHAG